jgi:hypothetical protein
MKAAGEAVSFPRRLISNYLYTSCYKLKGEEPVSAAAAASGLRAGVPG